MSFDALDAWVTPTTLTPAARISDLDAPDAALEAALAVTRNTQPGNYLDLCGVSIPLPTAEGELPVGLQLLCRPGDDRKLLMIAMTCEEILGSPRLADVSGFAGR